MHCQGVKLPGGGTAIVCGPKPRAKKCSVCHRDTREPRLCDFPMQAAKTCDVVLCPACAVRKEPDVDYCPRHASMLTPEGRLKL